MLIRLEQQIELWLNHECVGSKETDMYYFKFLALAGLWQVF